MARNVVIVGAGLLLLAAVILLFVDPFSWHILDRVRGDYDAALVAIPPDSTAYLSINLLSPSRDRLDTLKEIFSSATSGTGVDLAELQRRIGDAVLQDGGISVEEDIIPWLGQYIGVAAVAVRLDPFGEFDGVDWVISAETRNRGASDQFLTKLKEGWTSSLGETARTSVYDGVTLNQFEQITFGQSGSLVLLGSTPKVIQQAIDAQNGDSLADLPGFDEAVAKLPADRLVTAYTHGDQLNELIASIPTALPRISPENLPTASIRGSALALTLVEEGIQVDSVTVYDPDKLSALQRTALESRSEDPVADELFPADTLLFLSGTGVDLFWASVRRSLIAELGRADFEESMQLFQREFSINPDEALFPLLTGEAAVGLVPSSVGTIASDSGFDVGLIAVAGTSDQASLADNLATFSERIGSPIGGLGAVRSFESEQGVTVYEFSTILIPDLLFAYGVGHGNLLLGSSAEVMQSMTFSGGESLANRPAYRQVWPSFPEMMSPGLFIDVDGLLGLINEGGRKSDQAVSQLSAALQPVEAVASASSVDDNIATTRIIIFVGLE